MHPSLASLPVTDPVEQPDFVTALARGIAVIRAFGTQSKRMSLAEIARQVGLPRATVRRSLITLETLGYVENDGKTFMLTPKVLSLGHSYLMSIPVTRVVQPYLEKMSTLFNENASAGIFDHGEAVYVAQVPARRALLGDDLMGIRFPAYCTSMGRVLLAGQADDAIDDYLAHIELHAYTPWTNLDTARIREAICQARRDSFAIVEEEFYAGVVAISVPIKDVQDRTIAAFCIRSHVDRANGKQMIDHFLPHLREAANELRDQLV